MDPLWRWLRSVPLRLRALVRRQQAERDLHDELQFHIEQEVKRHIARGLSPDEARAVAHRQVHSLEALKDACRDKRGTAWLEDALRDLRHALRTLRRSPGFTTVAVLTLAIGVGVNTAVFTVIDAALFKGFRLVHDNGRILYVNSTRNGLYSGVSYPDFLDWQHQSTAFQSLAVVGDMKVLCDASDGVRQVCSATRITANGFRLLGVEPMLGRAFTTADDVQGATPVAILSYAFWEAQFAKNPAVVGRRLRVKHPDDLLARDDGAAAESGSVTIIGVMPKGFSFPQAQDMWVPLVPNTPGVDEREDRSLWFAFGRLADGATPRSAQAELETIGGRLAETYPGTNRSEVPQLQSFAEFFVDRDAPAMYRALWGAITLVLLIACANLGNLLLARAAGRSREIAIRAAIGAGRWRIIRQLFIENLALSTIGAIGAWLVAQCGVRLYALATNPPAGRWNHDLLDYSTNAGVFGYFLAISLGAGLLFGFAPALWLTRVDLNTVMKESGPTTTGGRARRRWSSMLVMAEVALAMVLVVGAGLMVRSFLNMYTAKVGAATDHVASMLLRVPASRYPDRARKVAFYDRLKARVEAVPGVQSMALGPAPASSTGMRLLPYDAYDAPAADEQHRPTTAIAVIGPEYFRTLDATVITGRDFWSIDAASSPAVAIVNQRLANRQWPHTDVVGRRLRLMNRGTPGGWVTVVGVASDITYDARRQQTEPMVYLPYSQLPDGGEDPWVQVRTSVPVDGVLGDLRRAVHDLDPDVLLWIGPDALRDQLALTAYGRQVNQTALLMIFAGIALLLAAVGLYAVLAHAVSQRIAEIGVRAAMGATARDIRAMVFRQGMWPVCVGLAIGAAAAAAAAPALRSQLVGVLPSDAASFAAASFVLIAAALLGCALPARRASRIDPVIALRRE